MPGTANSVDFRRAMGRWPTGVSVVTTHADGEDAGLTVNAFLSISLAPPLVLVSLTRDATSTPLMDRAGRFAVNLLAAGQRSLSERFALQVPSQEKFEGIPWHRGLGGVPLLDGALTHLECSVRSAQDVEDHRLFIGVVEQVGTLRAEAPLLYHRSQYGVPDAEGWVQLVTTPDLPPPASNPRPPS
jgi:flavin reductase (DIM6/NTAB) family NADH-FMN oxidoreductase RutF